MDIVTLQAARAAAKKDGNSTYRQRPWGNTIVLLGNSRVFLECTPPGNTTLRTLQRGVFTWANMFLRQRLRILNYAGVSGDTLTGMAARFSTAVAPFAPATVYIADAINDISGGATFTEIQNRYLALIDLCRSIQARTILATISPRDANTAAQNLVLSQVNAWLRSLNLPDVLVIDITTPIASATTMTWASGMSTDGLHQSRVGAARQGRHIADVLDPLIPRAAILPQMAGDPGNPLPNPFMSGTVGAGIPSGWTVFPAQGSGGIAYSLVARTDQRPGNWFQMDTTSASADAFANSVGSLSGVATTGDYIQGVIEMASDAWTSVGGQVRLYLQLLDASNTILASYEDNFNFTGSLIGDNGDSSAYPLENQPGLTAPVIFRTIRGPVPSGATQAKLLWEFNGQGKVRLGRAGVMKVT